jgi:hypothetical protein
MLKVPTGYDRYTSSPKFKDFSHQISGSLLGVCYKHRALVDESEMIRTQGRIINHAVAAVHGAL